MFRGHNKTGSTLSFLTFKVLLEEDLRMSRDKQGEDCNQAEGGDCKLSHGRCDRQVGRGRGKYLDEILENLTVHVILCTRCTEGGFSCFKI